MPRGQRIQEVSLRGGRVNWQRDAARRALPMDSYEGKGVNKSERPHKSKMIDALDFFGAYRGVREKHTRISFEVLRRMARQCMPMKGIVHLRCNQAAAFAKKARFESDTGFRITTRDPDQKVSKAAKKEIRKLEQFFELTGWDPNPRRDNLDLFLRKIVRDSLILDAYAFEVVPGRNPDKTPVAELWAVDGATIRYAEEEQYIPSIEDDLRGEVAFIQEIDGRITAEYTYEELAYGIRNPKTDVDCQGYGESELEGAMNTITSILFAEQYNRGYFSNNSTPRGIISVVGNYGDDDLENFKRSWRAQLEGAMNAWRTPLMAMEDGQGINFIPLDQKGNRDMEYHLWLDWLTNCLCAVYQVNPEELGFQGYQPQGKALSEASPEAAIEKGEDKGLIPLMTNISNHLNTVVVWRVNEDFVIEWEGLQSDDRMAKQQYYTNWINSGVLLVNEVREEALDREPIDQEWAKDAPANATLMQAYAAKKQADQMAANPQMNPATAGGPQMPPNNLLNHPAFAGDKQNTGAKPPAGNMPPGATPPVSNPGAPKPPVPGGQPFRKSLSESGECVIEIEFTE